MRKHDVMDDRNIQIRLAEESDNRALIRLGHEVPSVGFFSLYMDRAPDFFEFTRLQGETPHVWVAQAQDRIVGCFAGMVQRLMFQGREMSVAQVTDLKVHPDYRGKGVGERMLLTALRKGVDLNIELAMATIIEGNQAALAVLEKFSGSAQPAIAGGKVHVVQLLPLKKYTAISGYRVRTAMDRDIPEMAALLRRTYRDYFLAPDFTETFLCRELQKTDTFTLRDFRVAERGGKIVACAGFWDQDPIRRKVLLRLSPLKSAFVSFLKIFRSWLGIPHPPGPGDVLKSVHLRFPGAVSQDMGGLTAILHQEMNNLRRKGVHHFILAGFHESDPLYPAVSQIMKLSMDLHLAYVPLSLDIKKAISRSLPKSPCYVDFSLI